MKQSWTIVDVSESGYNGVTARGAEWSYVGHKPTHLVPKLGRRCGKHHGERGAHSLEAGLIRKEERQEARQRQYMAEQAERRHMREIEGTRNPVLNPETFKAWLKGEQ